ncbi:hypothetical protein RCL1_006270 [Eukaryota sp. TZLM3-RCL]
MKNKIEEAANYQRNQLTPAQHSTPTFAIGDLVLRLYPKRTSKLHGHDGPFEISKALGSNSYEITHLGTGRTYQASAYQLHPFLSTHSKQLLQHVAAGDVEECIPEEVLDHEKRDQRLMFLIQWSDGDTTWEEYDTVKNTALCKQYIIDNDLQSHIPKARKTSQRRKGNVI